jgi:peptide chain release factor subunit 1
MGEVLSFEDDVHGQHEQGGWSQARYQRSVEKEVMDHVKNACDRLFEMFQRRPFDKLLVGCPQEMSTEVTEKLHPYLTERLVAQFDADMPRQNADDVMERVRPLIESDQRRAESELISRLADHVGRDERAASGLEAVLFALNERRVDVLLLAPGFHARGVVCRQCEWMALRGTECPIDRGPLEPVDDIIEWAVRSAVLQSGTVHEVRYHEPESALGGQIAALLRF